MHRGHRHAAAPGDFAHAECHRQAGRMERDFFHAAYAAKVAMQALGVRADMAAYQPA